MARTETNLDLVASSADALERRLTDAVTAGQLTTELIVRLEARVAELERVTARMRDHLQRLGVTTW